MDDWHLLREYVGSGSQAAFAELVSRHIDLVYAACLRRLRHRQDAEDATQAVFLLLSRKARSIPGETVLAGWLYRAAGFVARDAARGAAVRRKHEMKAAPQAPGESSAGGELPSVDVDRALARLRPGDRDAILLRYFEGQSFCAVGRQLRISEEAARKRVSRGLERLRQVLAPPGGAIPSIAATELLLHAALHSAPAGLASATLAAVASGPAAAGPVASLANGATSLMALSKTKALTLSTLALLLIGGGTVATVRVLRPPADETLAIPRTGAQPAPDVTTVGADNWEPRFRQAYALADGEVIKPVAPIPERQQFWDDQCRKMGGRSWKLAKTVLMTLDWDGKSFRWSSLGSTGTVVDAIGICAGLKPYQIDSSLQRQAPHLRSDWVSRLGASVEAKMAALGRIASQQLGRDVRFEKRRVMRDAIIVRGHFAPAPGVVTLTDGRYPKNLGQPPVQHGSLAEFLNTLEDRIRRKVFNETGDTKSQLSYRDLMPDDSHIPQVLERLTKETSLTFTVEPREMDVWFMSEGPATTAASN